MEKNNVRYTYKEVHDIFKEKGYELLDREYINRTKKMKCMDNDGYKYHTSLAKMLEGKPQMISCNNPYTIENIKKYIKNNELDCQLISDKWIKNNSDLIFECPCGNTFETSWSTFTSKNKVICNTCVLKNKHDRFNISYVQNELEKIGLTLIDDVYTNNCTKINVKCGCGEVFMDTFANIRTRNRNKCKRCTYREAIEKKLEKNKEVYFGDGRIMPCDYCNIENIDTCNYCKTYGYFKRNYVSINMIDGWNVGDIVLVVHLILNGSISYLNDLCGYVKRDLREIVDLLTNKIKIGGSISQLVKLNCACCGKELTRKKSEVFADRVYCGMECRDTIRTQLFDPVNKFSLDHIRNLCLKNGGTMLSTEYTSNREKIDTMDSEGYKYETYIDKLLVGGFGSRFNKSNKYSIENIKNYIKLNNVNVELISDKYLNNSFKLEFKCACKGNFTTSWSGFKNGKTTCDPCSGFKKWDIDSVRKYVKEKTRCEVISNDYENNETKLLLECHCGNEFETMLIQIQAGLKECKECSLANRVNPRKKEYDEVYKIFQDNGLELLEEEYKGFNTRNKCRDKDGYFLYESVSNLLSGKSSRIFGCGNPFTTENVAMWLRLNEPTYKLIEKEVNNCRDKILFECEEGHRYRSNWTNFQMGRRCPKCRNERISQALSNDIDTFKKYVVDTTKGEYECISNEYVDAATKVKFRHHECGREFMSTPAKFTGSKNRNGSRCPQCQSELIESVHATVLKQLFNKYKEDVVLEDPSCINPLTGSPLPTDIVCYSEKIVVEIQSWFHDREYQKIKDKIKKDYWESRGFTVYSPDVRDYSSLSMAKIFFEDMVELPKWIDYKYGRKQIDIRTVQDMLNQHKSTKEIGAVFGVGRHTIQRLIANEEVYVKDEHWRILKNVKNIYMLSLEGNVLNIYSSATDAANKNDGFHQPCISKAIKNYNGCNHYGGYIWLSEEDFKNGNYNIDRTKIVTGKRPIVQLSLEGDFMNSYNSIIEATKAQNISKDAINRCLNGSKGQSKGFRWMYKEDYENAINE